ncbi:MAG: sugar ABC transporter ATP-binding protein [Phycisphaerales bacterium]|nr:sugar ABC transporter ATP-binding protein [Phycisphaerales bacterium]
MRAEPADAPAFLEAAGISKRFGSTQALDGVTVSFRAGEVHALMGENGAGKSTLGKVIAGIHRPDAGRVNIAGRELRPGSTDDASDAGVRIVHQELAQCPNLSVAENLCLHDMPRRGVFVSRRAMLDRAAGLVHALEPRIDVASPMDRLPPGWRQICQIASALDEGEGGAHPPRAIVFDEPTSSLSAAEVERLLRIVRGLAARGLTIIYVSHRMGEIFACCDRVTVLRDGRFVATSKVKAIDEPALVEQMIGRRISTPASRLHAGAPAHDAAPVLDVRGLNAPGTLHGISLSVRTGEIVGLGGLVGAGRSETLDAIFGLNPQATGEVRIGGSVIPRHEPRAAIRAGMGYVPEDRRAQGLFFELGLDENIALPSMPRLAGRLGWRSLRAERSLVRARFTALQVKAASLHARPGQLSGGNQQKLLIARWMGRETKVLLLDEPTRGIDIGTKMEIYRLIREAAAAGTAVLLVSSEMPELIALSDRVLVMADGHIAGELAGDAITQTNVLTLATRERNHA